MTTMMPHQELSIRWERCRKLLHELVPQAGGLIVFSRLNIYYLTGTFGNGVLWLPLDGEPVFLCRRGYERARLESPLKKIYSFSSYRDVEPTLQDAGAALPKTIAVEMGGLSWMLGNSFAKYLPGREFVSGDRVLSICRSKKTAWELDRLRTAGKRHEECLVEKLPGLLKPGMTELEIGHVISDIFFREGHHGILRMENYGEEVYQGYIAVGESGNYPSVFNGPLGLRGIHPAVPHMGSHEVAWQSGMPLSVDNGFTLEGYQTDKTQVYWLGERKSIPDGVQRAHDFCIDVQAWVSQHLKPGALPSDIWAHCSASAEKQGWTEGFMGLGKNKVNFVGHGIGLAIDEYPALAKGFDRPLEEGMVIAVEPKMGIPGVGMVGVENTFEVTARGGRSLTGTKYDIICIAA
jgi:Xaa-Pro aminopeptidase